MHDEWTVPVTRSRTAEIDESEVRRAVEILFHPADYHLVQSLPSGQWGYTRASDSSLIATIIGLATGAGVYFSLNSVGRALDHCLRSSDVGSRRWFLIDVDTNRADSSQMATDAEREASKAVALAIHAFLSMRGWPSPILIDSGNGWHLLYRIDLPADRQTQQVLRKCLVNLGQQFNTDAAHVDKSTHDAKRISKLPGTWVRKGQSTDDRPHRVARIVHAPETVEVVDYELLAELADVAHGDAYEAPEPQPKAKDEWKVPVGGNGNAYVEKAFQNELTALALSPQGERNNMLNKAAFSLGQLVDAGLDRGRVERELRMVAEAIGLDAREITLTLASGLEAGMASPRQVPERAKAERNGKHELSKIEKPPIPADGPGLIIWASDVRPKRVEWLWPKRIPLGKLTTFAGQGGLGKTFVLCDIASRVSRGNAWPHAGGECAEPGKILFISGEDDEDDTLVPRLIECGCDLSKVAFLSAASHQNFTLAALELLGRVVDHMHDVRFVAIDPPTSYLGGVDDHKNAELRGLLTPLKHWASEKRVAIVLNNHVNKAIGQNVEAAARVMGSVAWVNAVRAAHMFTKDPEEKGRVLFTPIKMNVSTMPMGLTYRIIATRDDLARVEWLDEVDITADDAVRTGPQTPRRVQAKTWLETAFTNRQQWPSDEIVRAAREAGISRSALWEAKGIMPIKARRSITADGESVWIWTAEEGWPPATQDLA